MATSDAGQRHHATWLRAESCAGSPTRLAWWWWCTACLAALFSVASRAAAQNPRQAFWVVPATDAADEMVAQAQRALSAHLDMKSIALEVLDDADCDLACAVRQGAEAGNAPAVQLELWVPRAFRKHGSVAVTMTDAQGTAVGKARLAQLNPNSLDTAVKEALAQALSSWPARGGSIVRIDGTPAGASFVIDRNPSQGGTVPTDLRLTPGPHVISVSHYGYREREQTFHVPVHSEEPFPVHIELLPIESRHGQALHGPRRQHWLHRTGPAVLAVLGIATLSIGAVALMRDDDCQERASSGTCLSRHETNRLSALSLTLAGSLALAGAVGWGAWAFVDVQADHGAVAGMRMPLSGKWTY